MSTLRIAWVSFGCVALSAAAVCAQSVGAAVELSEAEQALLGCYDVTEGEWEPHHVRGYGKTDTIPTVMGIDSARYQVPPRIRLSGGAGGLGGRAPAIEIPPGALPVPNRYKTWRADGDSLGLGFGDGFTGVTVRLARSDGGWVGTAYTRSDNLMPSDIQGYMRLVRLRPVDCDSPPPVSADVVRPLLRSIALAGGGTLTLGEPLPVGYTTEPRLTRTGRPTLSGARTLVATTIGPLPATDSIIVHVDRELGVVSRLELRYRDPVRSDELLAALEAATGPFEADVFRGRLMSYTAKSRTTQIRLIERSQPMRVLVTDREIGR